MVQRIVITLNERICKHCPDPDIKKWTWWMTPERKGYPSIHIKCRICGAKLDVPYRDLRAILVLGDPSEIPPPEPPAPEQQVELPDNRERVTHKHEFTKGDIPMMRSFGISTEGIDFKD